MQQTSFRQAINWRRCFLKKMTAIKGVMIASYQLYYALETDENADKYFYFSERNCFRTSRWCDDCELIILFKSNKLI